MAQHFLLSKSAKTLSLASVFQMKDDEAEMAFRRIRWADTDGEPVCPHCASDRKPYFLTPSRSTP